MNIDTTLKVTEIQRFCMHDGPGIRTTVFFKGCPLRCAWCHNPETQNADAELLFYSNKCIGCSACAEVCPSGAHTVKGTHIYDRDKCIFCFECAESCPAVALETCGKDLTVGHILSELEKDRAFFGKDGGVTLSGGEPFVQKNIVDLLKACKDKDFSVAVETCGHANTDVVLAAVPFVDLFLWDIKDTDSQRHKQYIGTDNALILKNLHAVDGSGARIRLRCILVNGVNTFASHYLKIAETAASLSNCEGVELLPYHAYGGSKTKLIGGEDNGRRDWIPEKAELERAIKIISEQGVKAFCNGLN